MPVAQAFGRRVGSCRLLIWCADSADRDDTPIAVDFPLVATHRLARDEVSQGKLRILAAAIDCASRFARLPRLRRIDAMQSSALAVDLDGIAVDDCGLPHDIGGGVDQRDQEYDRQGSEAKHNLGMVLCRECAG